MGNVLFESFTVAGLTLANRIKMSAAASYSATPEGDIDYTGHILHFDVARGGCGLVPTGGIGGVHISGRISPTSPLFNSDERIPAYRKFADTIHEGGARALLQITHSGGGAAAHQQSLGRKPLVPSFIFKRSPAQSYLEADREECPATEEEIIEVIAAYGDAALRAKRAGFDGIEIHGAHESLLMQFLSPVTNARTDRWGGSIENRSRIHREITKEMKKKAGADFPVFLKLGVQDAFPGGMTFDDGLEAALLIAGESNLDALEISQGLSGPLTDMNNSSMKPGITTIEKEAYYRDWTRKIKEAVKKGIAVIMQGGLRTPSLMEEILEKGEADLVSMCRPYIREPGIVRRWQSGDMKRAACVSCNRCVIEHALNGKPLRCWLEKER